MLRALFLFLLVLFLARAIWKLLDGIIAGARDSPVERGSHRTRGARAVKMAKDPVCGTFVVPGKAPSLVRAGETLYFCSDRCRETFAAR